MQFSCNGDDWLHQAVDVDGSFEASAVAHFANRMLCQARAELPRYLSSRIDPEDIVQSVFHSFFKKHRQGAFEFASSNDVWKLLSAMTYKKVCNKIRFNHRRLRDVGREDKVEVKNVPAESAKAATASAITIMMELFQEIVRQLPQQHQEILLLRMNDYTIEEIAQEIQVSSRTVDRALKRVREICGKLRSLE